MALASGDEILYNMELSDMLTDVMSASSDVRAAGSNLPQSSYKTYAAAPNPTWDYLAFDAAVVAGYEATDDVLVEGEFICDLADAGTVRVEAAFYLYALGVDVRLAPPALTYTGVNVAIGPPTFAPYFFSILIPAATAALTPKRHAILAVRRQQDGVVDDALGNAKFDPSTLTARKA